MSNQSIHEVAISEAKRLVEAFFRAVSFETRGSPSYASIYDLFIETGLLIKNTGAAPEICSVTQFIQSRQALVDSGDLTRFHEAEISEATEAFGKVAHRFSAYFKSGTLKGTPFDARGLVSTQLILTPAGWKISSMAWDDERPGLCLPEKYEP